MFLSYRFVWTERRCRLLTERKCDAVGDLQDALTIVGHSGRPPFVEGKISFRRVQQEIDSGRPLGVRMQWRDGEAAHFLAIVGYHTGYRSLTIADPIYGRSEV